jgi:hypothetical protein
MTEQQLCFLRGCCATILAFAVTGLLASIFLASDEPKDTSKFEVLDHYQGCSVIRYTDPTSRWHYFLKCS